MKKFLVALLIYLVTLPVLAENTILVIGDSLSAGYGIDPNKGWVQLLRGHLKELKYPYQIVNASISGDTLSNGLQRAPKAIAEANPQITIIELGANDGLRGLPPGLIKKNLDQMINLALEAHSKVLVLGVRLPPNYGPAYDTQFQQIYSELTARDDIAVIPLFLTGVDDKKEWMQDDGLHPNLRGQAAIADTVWASLQKLLAY
jgi:acyl-CoA thioesterase-1